MTPPDERLTAEQLRALAAADRDGAIHGAGIVERLCDDALSTQTAYEHARDAEAKLRADLRLAQAELVYLRAELKAARVRELSDCGEISALRAEVKHAQLALQDALIVMGGGK
jgi:multidrug resistance efflux pump